MKVGKLPENVLKRSVFKMINARRDEVIVRPGVGLDCSVLDLGEDELLVMSTDPITGAATDIGKLAVHVTANDLASNGATAIGIMVTALLPTNIKESQIKNVMQELDEECGKLNMEVIGGHTEVTTVVNQIVLSVTGVGKIKKDKLLDSKNVKAGYEIVVTKAVGLEGTSIIANSRYEELCERFPKEMVDAAKLFVEEISVVPEGMIAIDNGAVFMHDVTEGGIFGALWEVASAAQLGIHVDLKKIPIRQETVEICNYVDINPYMLISSGSMIIATEHGNSLVAALKDKGIDATVIGVFTEGNDKIVQNGDDRRFLEQPAVDELYKAIEDKGDK